MTSGDGMKLMEQITTYDLKNNEEFKKADYDFHLFVVQYNFLIIKLMAQAH